MAHLPPGKAHWLVPGSLLRCTKRYSLPVFTGRPLTITMFTAARGCMG